MCYNGDFGHGSAQNELRAGAGFAIRLTFAAMPSIGRATEHFEFIRLGS